MEVLHFFRRLYSLDTLDTRLTTSSLIPLAAATDESAEKPTSERRAESEPASLPAGASPSKWRIPEFYFYYTVIILVVPQMFRSVMNVSRRGYII
jgi:protein-cysteine N-palmitoyltransferase HHAT